MRTKHPFKGPAANATPARAASRYRRRTHSIMVPRESGVMTQSIVQEE